jgi:hypothetical protein
VIQPEPLEPLLSGTQCVPAGAAPPSVAAAAARTHSHTQPALRHHSS